MTDWLIGPEDAIIIFPDDIVMLRDNDNEFMAEALVFSPKYCGKPAFNWSTLCIRYCAATAAAPTLMW